MPWFRRPEIQWRGWRKRTCDRLLSCLCRFTIVPRGSDGEESSKTGNDETSVFIWRTCAFKNRLYTLKERRYSDEYSRRSSTILSAGQARRLSHASHRRFQSIRWCPRVFQKVPHNSRRTCNQITQASVTREPSITFDKLPIHAGASRAER